ncbi:rod shape-determining protein MreC [Nitratiruptor tergarcus]|uniref:Rod shape-determining protein MreC n=1 Tax=Nitratiruptor tergarcus DSM 16512 TaxID=1069081 RepID=A0A1W1WSP7_9BACT|nr:rod shape-determining protein MreC [Nitratiruptor tergarcus]SMC09222.1 rod shape-determining protein MreC [Nitratiruptor tergarcus DSM 16512]
MIKRVGFVIAALLLALLFFEIDSHLRNAILTSTNFIKSTVVKTLDNIDAFFYKYLNQADKIAQLQRENRELQKSQLLVADLQQHLQSLMHDCNISLPYKVDLRYVRALAYEKFGDFTALWLDTKLQSQNIAGLLKGEYVAGIAIEKNGKTLALLNGNTKCSYGVIIGEKAQGVATGSGDNRFVIVKYIPNYENFHVGQQVVTSGLDKIFVYGLKVGVVIKIWQEGSYKVAKVRTFANLSHPRFFWLMKL